METRKRYYSNEFKQEAVRLSNQRDNIKELADELGISVERIYKWRSVNRSTGNLKTRSTNPPEDSSEVKRLKKELKNSQLELEILKKAVHIFSKSDGKSINL